MKIIANLTCVIYTVLILIFTLFSYFNLAPAVTNTIAVQGFIMSLSVAVFMRIAEKIEMRMKNSNMIFDTLVKIGICYLVVFLEGSYFKMIEFSWKGLLEITPALIPIFLVTYAVQYFTCISWANSINENIRHHNQ